MPDCEDEGAFFGIASDDSRTAFRPSLQHRLFTVETKATHRGVGVATEAIVYQDRTDLILEKFRRVRTLRYSARDRNHQRKKDLKRQLAETHCDRFLLQD